MSFIGRDLVRTFILHLFERQLVIGVDGFHNLVHHETDNQVLISACRSFKHTASTNLCDKGARVDPSEIVLTNIFAINARDHRKASTTILRKLTVCPTQKCSAANLQ